MTLDELIVRIRVAADGSSEELDGLMDELRAFAAQAQKSGGQVEKATMNTAAAWAALSATASSAFKKITGAIQSGIEASNAYAAAVKGLSGVADGAGIGQQEMQQALDAVTDEFFSATAAATSFKNLLSRGYTLDQATRTITNLKNAAAFGRQSSLSLSQAVVSATEGIRNENSILVDNAGVTKNVAKMWEEYAKARGVATTSLTQAQKVEAEYLGIMEETRFQMGDIEKLSEGLAGAQAKAANQTELLARSFGEAMTPGVELGTTLFSGIMEQLTGVSQVLPGITAGLTTASGAMTGFVAASAGLKTAKELMQAIGLTTKTLGPLGLVAAALGVVAGAYTAVKKAQEAAAKAEEERMQANRDAVSEQEARLARLNELTERYTALSQKTSLSYSEQREMVSIQEELASAYGVTAGSVDGLAGSLDEYIQKLKEARDAEAEILTEKKKQVTQDAYLAANAQEYLNAMTGISEQLQYRNNAMQGRLNGQISLDEYQNVVIKTADAMEGQLETLQSYNEKFIDWFNAGVDEQLTAIKARGGEVNEALAEQLTGMFAIDLASFNGDTGAANAYVDGMVQAVAAACSNTDASEAVEAARSVMQKVLDGTTPTEEDAEVMLDAWGVLFGEEGALTGYLAQLSEMTGETVPALAEEIMAMLTGFEGLADGSDMLASSAASVRESLEGIVQEQRTAGESAEDYADAVAEMEAELKELDKQARNVADIKKNIDAYKDARKAYDDARKSGQNVEKAFDDMSGAAKKLGVNVDKGSGSLEDMDKAAAGADTAVDALGAAVQSEGGTIVSTLQGMLTQARQTEQALMIQASMGVDVSQPLSAIQAVISLINTLLALMGQAGITASGGGGGGGGGSDEEDAAEAARRAAEEAERRRREALEADYRAIEHRRHMNEISFEEELAQLEALRQKHQMNAEEIMDWEEKVYDLKQEIRERDAESLDNLSDSVLTALENRYEAMLEAEQQRLDESRKTWEKWRDDSVAAIEDQIAALDKLADTEDREKQDAEELRKIERLRQQIAYEQDDYNRAKLQQQLDQALESREERLARLALQDQKDALRAEIDQIEKKADSQLEALDREQEAIEAAYEERMKDAALQAEAEKLILTQSQDELLSLISSYAPEYDALGQTLGEKLLDGFKEKVGEIAQWFDAFNARMLEVQQQMAQTAQSAADTFYDGRQTAQAAQSAVPAVTVNQTVEFNQPVETPAQVARRMEEVNEALALML